MQDFLCEQDAAGAGAESRLVLREGLKGIEEAAALEKLEHGGRFAAGKDEAVESGQLFGGANEDWLCAGFGEGRGVGCVVALDGEYADKRALNCCG
jgi:hypothetical protein